MLHRDFERRVCRSFDEAILVAVKPEIKKFTGKTLLLKSKDSITCEASGNPQPVATLMKKGKDGKFKILDGQSVSFRKEA